MCRPGTCQCIVLCIYVTSGYRGNVGHAVRQLPPFCWWPTGFPAHADSHVPPSILLSSPTWQFVYITILRGGGALHASFLCHCWRGKHAEENFSIQWTVGPLGLSLSRLYRPPRVYIWQIVGEIQVRFPVFLSLIWLLIGALSCHAFVVNAHCIKLWDTSRAIHFTRVSSGSFSLRKIGPCTCDYSLTLWRLTRIGVREMKLTLLFFEVSAVFGTLFWKENYEQELATWSHRFPFDQCEHVRRWKNF